MSAIFLSWHTLKTSKRNPDTETKIGKTFHSLVFNVLPLLKSLILQNTFPSKGSLRPMEVMSSKK